MPIYIYTICRGGLSMKVRNNRGFTLVELIVVLVILAILAAILVPALLGYIDRSKNQKYIIEARELMRAAQVSIAEAYATNDYGFRQSIRPGPITGDKRNDSTANYGYFTNGWSGVVLGGGTIDNKDDPNDLNGGVFKKTVCEKMAVYLEKNNYPKVSTETPNMNGARVDVDYYTKKGECAYFIAYDVHGQIIYMQYTNEGKLVTFDGKSFEVTDGGKFVNYKNSVNNKK